MDVKLDVGEVAQGGITSFGECDTNADPSQVNHSGSGDETQETDFGGGLLMTGRTDEVDVIPLVAPTRVAAAAGDEVDMRHHGFHDRSEHKPLVGGQTSNNKTEDEEKESLSSSKEKFCFLCTKEELTGKVCHRLPLWVIMVFLVIVIVCVIIGTLALCAAIHVDEDDEFDHSLFIIPHYFNGSINLPPNSFYNKSQVSADLQQKLTDLYRSSHTLGRYFSAAEIFALRNASVEYQLTFVLPEEEQEELRNFTLSREMVRNVFRQFLYDQDPVKLGGMPIDKASLKISPVYMRDFHEQTDEDR